MKAFTIHLERTDLTSQWVASLEEVAVYGVGDTAVDAVKDLLSAAVDMYGELTNDMVKHGSLSEHLQQECIRLEWFIENCSD